MTVDSEYRVRVAVLGPVLIEARSADGAALIEPPGAMAKSLAAALVLARGTVSVRGLVDDLWGDAPPRNEKGALQTLVSRLRAAGTDGLVASTPSGYALTLAPAKTDLGRARVHAERGSRALASGDAIEAQRLASDALDLWRGEPGADLGETEIAARVAASAASLHAQLLRIRAEARVEIGDDSGALHDLDRLELVSPMDDALELLRLRALAASGRTTDALRSFGDFRERLREELGTDPSPALVSFNAELLRGAPTGGAAATASPGSDSSIAKRVRLGL